MDFKWYSYTDEGVKDSFKIRLEVFCKEIGFTESFEFDEGDKNALHLVGYENGQAVCTARMLKEENDTWHIGRICVPQSLRGKGYGKLLIEQLCEKAAKLKAKRLTLGAKYDKKGFYEHFGFKAYGEIFTEEGIPHINMERTV